MRRLRAWFMRLGGLFAGRADRERREQELAAEIESHVQMNIEDNLRRGMSAEEARRQALIQLGGVEQTKEAYRERRGLRGIETLSQDVRYGLRMLRKNPGFTAVAVATLALGIGANTAIFSLVNSVLLRPLPYRDPQQLYVIREIVPQWAKNYPLLAANLPDFRIWQKNCKSFEQIAIAEALEAGLSGAGEAEEIHGVRASVNVFDTLGVRPALGRNFLPEEDEAGHDRVVILTDPFWRGRFHADPSVVGRTITLDGEPHVVAGVLPASFHFSKELASLTGYGSRIDFFKPVGAPKYYEEGLIGEFDFAAIARLKSGVTPEQAVAELNVVQAEIAKQADEKVDLRAQIFPLEDEVAGSARRGLILLLAAIGAVLLIVCVNLANLLLARVPGRMREAAIRTALGATRLRLVRQMLTESLLLALLGGLFGIWLANFGVQWLVHVAPVDIPRLDEVSMDARALWFAVVLSSLTGAFFGILPAWRIAHAEPQETLKSGGASISESRRTRRLRESLIGLEVGLCTLLLIVAGLLADSLFHVVRVNAGFNIERVLAADIDLPPQSYSQPAARNHFYEQALAGIRVLPGVQSAGWVSVLPLEGHGSVSGISLPGEQVPAGQQPFADYRAVSSSYFETMGISLLAGRLLTENDHGRRVIVVSQSVAERFWPGANPVGKECAAQWGELQRSEVIGVVGDIHTIRLDEPPLLMVYVADSYGEKPPSVPSSAAIVVRTTMDPSALANAVRSAIHGVDPDVPVVALRPMTEVVSASTSARRFQMSLALLFALCALFLAALGIFGVIAYSVEQRSRELGIRRALGAQTTHLLRLVLRQGMTPVVAGFAAGAIAALLVGRLIQSFLFGVSAADPVTLLSVALVVGFVACAACYIPARRAMRVDPIVALRYE